MDKNKYVTAAFLDLSKAFDSIQHDILETKLRQIGFDDLSTRLVMDFNSERIQKVITNNSESEWIKLYQGVPQGTVLGPLLFNLYQ